MPHSLTLENIPHAVHERLKQSAQKHRRSLNSEAIVCLEAVLLPSAMTPDMAPDERLARVRALRASLTQGKFKSHDIDELRRERRS